MLYNHFFLGNLFSRLNAFKTLAEVNFRTRCFFSTLLISLGFFFTNPIFADLQISGKTAKNRLLRKNGSTASTYLIQLGICYHPAYSSRQ